MTSVRKKLDQKTKTLQKINSVSLGPNIPISSTYHRGGTPKFPGQGGLGPRVPFFCPTSAILTQSGPGPPWTPKIVIK